MSHAHPRAHAHVAMIAPISLIVVGLLMALLAIRNNPRAVGGGADRPALVVYCAAGIRPALEPAIARYERRTGRRVVVQYGGSGTLLSSIELTRTGDLYVAADDSYIDLARTMGLVGESVALAVLRPVIGVRWGNPLRITTTNDIMRRDVRLALANPDVAAIGRITRETARSAGIWDAMSANCLVFKPTVFDVATDIAIGSVDAGIIWDANALHVDGIEAVRADLFDAVVRTVAAGVVTHAPDPAGALDLARFLAAEDGGGPDFADAGFAPAGGLR